MHPPEPSMVTLSDRNHTCQHACNIVTCTKRRRPTSTLERFSHCTRGHAPSCFAVRHRRRCIPRRPCVVYDCTYFQLCVRGPCDVAIYMFMKSHTHAHARAHMHTTPMINGWLMKNERKKKMLIVEHRAEDRYDNTED